jgi:hypothetical protein
MVNKAIILFVLLLGCASPKEATKQSWLNENRAWHSAWFEVQVRDSGDVMCPHDWIVRENIVKDNVCLTPPDERGCPENWASEWRSCQKCGRYSHWIEQRIFERGY